MSARSRRMSRMERDLERIRRGVCGDDRLPSGAIDRAVAAAWLAARLALALVAIAIGIQVWW